MVMVVFVHGHSSKHTTATGDSFAFTAWPERIIDATSVANVQGARTVIGAGDETAYFMVSLSEGNGGPYRLERIDLQSGAVTDGPVTQRGSRMPGGTPDPCSWSFASWLPGCVGGRATTGATTHTNVRLGWATVLAQSE